jgi:hypothetical protein
MEWFCSLETAFRLCGRLLGSNAVLGATSGLAVIHPELGQFGVSLSGLVNE